MKIIWLSVLALALLPCEVLAHCDTLNGPVVGTARVALRQGNLTPLLKWIPAASEAELRDAFRRTLAVRVKGDDAREFADRWFFETAEEVIVRADAAIDEGSVDDLANDLGRDVAAGVRLRFNRLMEARKSAEQSVEAGRRHVAAYIDFTHYVEKIHRTGSDHEQH